MSRTPRGRRARRGAAVQLEALAGGGRGRHNLSLSSPKVTGLSPMQPADRPLPQPPASATSALAGAGRGWLAPTAGRQGRRPPGPQPLGSTQSLPTAGAPEWPHTAPMANRRPAWPTVHPGRSRPWAPEHSSASPGGCHHEATPGRAAADVRLRASRAQRAPKAPADSLLSRAGRERCASACTPLPVHEGCRLLASQWLVGPRWPVALVAPWPLWMVGTERRPDRAAPCPGPHLRPRGRWPRYRKE